MKSNCDNNHNVCHYHISHFVFCVCMYVYCYGLMPEINVHSFIHFAKTNFFLATVGLGLYDVIIRQASLLNDMHAHTCTQYRCARVNIIATCIAYRYCIHVCAYMCARVNKLDTCAAYRYRIHVCDTCIAYRYARVNIIATCIAYMYVIHVCDTGARV